MADDNADGKQDGQDGTAGRHEAARRMAERAVQVDSTGDAEEADRLFAEAARLDPDAVATVLAEQGEPDDVDPGPQSNDEADEEVAAMSRTIEPDSDAPTRAGITGSGSGADGQGL